MKKKWVLFIFIVVVFLFFGEAFAQKTELPERFKKWLEEEIVYIITPLEKEVFSKLKSDRERDLFMEAFWKQRDPTPGSAGNEFKQEHFRRINHVNHFFGRGMPKAGWRTDRGRVYIILGEPNDILRYEGATQIYPTEVWFYQGKTDIGLPPGFNLVFFQDGGVGEYKLYSPLRHGPQALMTSYYGDPIDYIAAYERLREFEPDLAEVSLSLIPGERSLAMGRPSLSSDVLIQRVETTPIREMKEKYAQKFLEYKDIVEVEYSANYITSDSLVKIIKDPSGIYFVHFAIEPERLSVNLFEEKYYTTLKVNGTVLDMEGKTIYQLERDISLEFNKEQIKQISYRPVSIRDMFPLIPGNFKMSVLVKNEISKEFTSLERELLIPGDEETLQMTSLLMGYRMRENVPAQNRLRPFQVGKYQIYVHANRTFVSLDNMVLTFQILGLNKNLREKGEIRYSFFKGGEEFRTITKQISDYSDVPSFVEQLSLKEFLPAHYRVQVSLFLDGREVLFEGDEFDVTHVESIARPWIYSKLLPASDDPVYSYLIGSQLFNAGKVEDAKINLEKAYQAKPDSIDFALNLVRIYMVLKEYQKIEPILFPFFNQPQPPEYEAYFIMGKAYQNLGQLGKAVEIFNKAIPHYGINMGLLNSLGECYFQLGETLEALAAWEKSLEINPDQPRIRKNVEAIKEKK